MAEQDDLKKEPVLHLWVMFLLWVTKLAYRYAPVKCFISIRRKYARLARREIKEQMNVSA